MSYKIDVPFKARKSDCEKILSKYPNKIPIIMEKVPFTEDDETNILPTNKILMDPDITISQMKEKLFEKHNFKLYLVPDKDCNMILQNLYDNEKSNDGFLYLSYVSKPETEIIGWLGYAYNGICYGASFLNPWSYGN